jgi:hypothetical protein
MKKFIFRSSLFIIPFFFLYALNSFLYEEGEGDLTRVGFLYSNTSPKNSILDQFNLSKYYKNVSELNLDTISKFDILSIGDSFSEQGSFGYTNFLAKENNSVLHFDKYLTDNDPIQKIIELANGDFFETIKTDYVILQSVERLFFERCEKLDFSKSVQINSIKNKINRYEVNIPISRNMKFLSSTTLKMPLANIQYLYGKKPSYSLTYKVETTTNNLFAGNTDNLLFSEHDLTKKKKYQNAPKKIENFNFKINKINNLLAEKNIKLILLICPDKYDLYYPYIKDQSNFMEPSFFKYYNPLAKDYLYVNSLEILTKEIRENKDVYFYDDTHWSPIGAKTIADAIDELIEVNNRNGTLHD